jgi:hypothetical protein
MKIHDSQCTDIEHATRECIGDGDKANLDRTGYDSGRRRAESGEPARRTEGEWFTPGDLGYQDVITAGSCFPFDNTISQAEINYSLCCATHRLRHWLI